MRVAATAVGGALAVTAKVASGVGIAVSVLGRFVIRVGRALLNAATDTDCCEETPDALGAVVVGGPAAVLMAAGAALAYSGTAIAAGCGALSVCGAAMVKEAGLVGSGEASLRDDLEDIHDDAIEWCNEIAEDLRGDFL